MSSNRAGSDSKKVEWFQGFLTTPVEKGAKYEERVAQMVEDGNARLIVSLNDLLNFDSAERTTFNSIMKQPHLWIPPFETALMEYVKEKHGGNTGIQLKKEYFIGFEGIFGAHRVSPRQLVTNFIGKLVCVEGIVTKLSLVRPKLVESVHFCPKTKKLHSMQHRDVTSIFGTPTAPVIVDKDSSGNALEMEYGLSTFKDYQTLTLQEMPERAPPGQLPRSVEVLVENDLVDRVKPGDRVCMMGVYRAIPNIANAQKSRSVFSTLLIANNIQMINKDIQGPVLTAQDIFNIRALCKDPDIFTILSNSLAPSIYGHDYVKKAILLQLLGGVEKDLKAAGIRLRGDINVLLVGDPGTAKSQLLRFVLHVAPLCISTTGRGASGVGLTAAVVHDKETQDRRLEAGAMVLADRGIVCIDEFDKMSPDDRVSIHEVMEQQTVTIAKAGIHASLNARCSVLGAANPLFGKYDRNKSAMENIALPDSLLSRFDLLFIILDNMDPVNDRNVADHVLRMHRYHSHGSSSQSAVAGSTNSSVIEAGIFEEWEINPEGENADQTSPIWLPHDKILHAKNERKACSIPFLKKYLLYAKERISPTLDDEAQQAIIEAYDNLRSREDSKTLPVTARTLETMIRLTVSHAKCRLSNVATLEDANTVLELMRFALYNDTTGANVIHSKENVTNGHVESNNLKKRVAPDSQSDSELQPPPAKRSRQLTEEESQLRAVEKALTEAFNIGEKSSVQEITRIASKFTTQAGDPNLTTDQVRKLLERLESQNRLMFLDNDEIVTV